MTKKHLGALFSSFSTQLVGSQDPFRESKMAIINPLIDLLCPLLDVPSSFTVFECHVLRSAPLW